VKVSFIGSVHVSADDQAFFALIGYRKNERVSLNQFIHEALAGVVYSE